MIIGFYFSIQFNGIVLISKTDDLVQKKIIYHYLVNYFKIHKEQALIAIKTMQS